MKKRCICGQSARLPLCDGAHAKEGWGCGQDLGPDVASVFVASPSLINLSNRLAHRFGGVSANVVVDPIRTVRLVVLCDGHGICELSRRMESIDYTELHLLAVDQHPSTLAWAFEDAVFSAQVDTEAPHLWQRVETLVSGTPRGVIRRARPVVFLSHAVADEGVIFPTVQTLRNQYGMEVFLCADSIPVGSAWRTRIEEALEGCTVFLLLASAHANRSVFCAFEAGCAVGRGKRMRLVCLDESGPPAPLQEIQGPNVQRIMACKPWLEAQDALLEACLDALGDED